MPVRRKSDGAHPRIRYAADSIASEGLHQLPVGDPPDVNGASKLTASNGLLDSRRDQSAVGRDRDRKNVKQLVVDIKGNGQGPDESSVAAPDLDRSITAARYEPLAIGRISDGIDGVAVAPLCPDDVGTALRQGDGRERSQ